MSAQRTGPMTGIKRPRPTRVLVSPDGKSRRLWVWAAFRLETDAYHYADEVRRTNPTWVIEVRK